MATQYVDMSGIDLSDTSSHAGPVSRFKTLLAAFENNDSIVLCNMVYDGVKVSPVQAYTRQFRSGTHLYMYTNFDLYTIWVSDTGSAKVTDLTPQPTPIITATTDELFVQTYLDALADGATVVVTPKARTQGQTYSLNLGTKVIYLDFSGYTGTVSITCTGFTSQGNKVYKVTGAITPWIQSESATAITINED